MKKNAITINFEDNTATVTKNFMRKSSTFGSKEYEIMRQFKAENPKIRVSIKPTKKNPDRESYKNLTYKNIKAYINTQDNAAELLKEFETAKAQSGIQSTPYRAVLAWFLSTFPDYDSYKEFFKNRGKNADDNESKTVDNDESHVVNLEKKAS